MVSDTFNELIKRANRVPRKELIKGIVYSTAYFFMLTITGILIVTAYDYFYPINIASEISILYVTLLFAIWLVIDYGLVSYGYPTPTIISILIVIAPVLIIYRLLKSNDLIQIDRNVPNRIKHYIPIHNLLKPKTQYTL